MLVVLQDFGYDDFSLLEDDQQDDLEDILPYYSETFRSASPDWTPSLASILTGQRPAELGIHRSYPLYEEEHEIKDKYLAPMSTLKENNVTIAHFGLWPFVNDPDDIFDYSYTSSDYSDVRAAVESYVSTLGDDEDYLINVWLPRIDATIDFGGNYTDDDWSAGISGVYERSGSGDGECPDTFRGDATYVARYKSCPRQIYRANRQHESIQLVTMLQNVQDTLEGSGANIMILTSTNGPESEQADSHSRGRTRFRGIKRSIYDGGVRVPLRYEVYGPSSDTAAAGWGSPSEDDFESAPITGVDLLPTLMYMIGNNSATESVADGLPGMDTSACWFGGDSCDGGTLVRTKPMLWEWRYLTPGHCALESPRYAIIMGDYKLLHEPGMRTELYDLSLEAYEVVNMYNATLSDSDAQDRLEIIKLVMMKELQEWIDYLAALEEVVETPDPTAQSHPGCYGRGEPQLSDGSSEAGDEPSVALNATERNKKLAGIIFILTDDMGVGEMSGYLANRTSELEAGLADPIAFEPKTPILDRLKDEGTTLYHFYAGMPVCSPSRTTIMTGRPPSHKQNCFHNIVAKTESANAKKGVPNFLGENIDYEEKLTTLTKFFHEQGYVTGHFGKWHMGYDYTDNEDYNTGGAMWGIDEYMLYGTLAEYQEDNVTFPTASKPHNNYLDNDDLLFASYVQHALVNRTIDFLEDRAARNETFFVNLWLQNPHAPLNLAESFDQPAAMGYPSEDNPMPNSDPGYELKSTVDKDVPLQIYRTLMHDQEVQIDRLISAIGDLGFGNRTLIVYMADNGPEDRTLNFVTVGNNDPFRGQKRSLYEGGIRVPLFMWWPGVVPAGRKVTYPATGADLFYTLASIAGLSEEFEALPDYKQLDYNYSKDLSCLAVGVSQEGGYECAEECSTLECAEEALGERPLYFEFRDYTLGDCLGRSPRIALRRGRYKALWEPKNKNDMFPTSSTGTIRLELFDLLADPYESNNLLLTQEGNSSYTEIAESLHADMLYWIQDSGRYDQEYTPKASYCRIRYDESFSTFYLQEQCTSPPEDASAPTSITVSSTKLETMSCSLSYWCNATDNIYSTNQPTYPFVSMAPTTDPSGQPTKEPTPQPTGKPTVSGTDKDQSGSSPTSSPTSASAEETTPSPTTSDTTASPTPAEDANAKTPSAATKWHVSTVGILVFAIGMPHLMMN